ncbi:MAG TPA: divalent metal cation transporter [Gaiellaceae bacterium]|nr:divalent metal cation transporter [Gaiellaceae bacterium]
MLSVVTRRLRRRHGRPPWGALLRRLGVTGFFLVVGPGLLAGLSDDDPAGITTYSLLGAEYGYTLLWVLVLSTGALMVFHELGSRLGIVTQQGLVALVRANYGSRVTAIVAAALVLANVGTTCAEFAGVAAACELAGITRYLSVPAAAVAVAVLVLRGSFHRVEHVLLALGAVFVAYIASGLLAGPDWGAAVHGMVVPHLPGSALVLAAATVGTTLAPWGLAFIQSYSADKELAPTDLRYERVDVLGGALMTGVIGVFVVVACAATLFETGREISDARDAAEALSPLAGPLAAGLFGIGLLGAALLAAAVVPLSTAYSVSEAFGREARLDDSFAEAPFFYVSYAGALLVGAAVVLIPGIALVPLLVLTQVLNAVLLLPLLVVMQRLGRDSEVMGRYRNGPLGTAAAAAAFALVAASVIGLGIAAVV